MSDSWRNGLMGTAAMLIGIWLLALIRGRSDRKSKWKDEEK